MRSHKWTPSEDKKLRVLVEMYRNEAEIPWQKIALKANMGHNSGSCKKRFLELPKLKYKECNIFTFTGAAGGGEVIAERKTSI